MKEIQENCIMNACPGRRDLSGTTRRSSPGCDGVASHYQLTRCRLIQSHRHMLFSFRSKMQYVVSVLFSILANVLTDELNCGGRAVHVSLDRLWKAVSAA